MNGSQKNYPGFDSVPPAMDRAWDILARKGHLIEVRHSLLFPWGEEHFCFRGIITSVSSSIGTNLRIRVETRSHSLTSQDRGLMEV
jgi:hypothetical protein